MYFKIKMPYMLNANEGGIRVSWADMPNTDTEVWTQGLKYLLC